MPSLLIYGIVALSILGTLAGIGYKIRESGKESVRLEWAEANSAARAAEAAKAATAADKKEKSDAKAKIVYRTITRDVDRVVVEYRDRACLDDDGLRLARSAILGTIPDPSKPDKPLRPAAEPDGRDGGISIALDRGGL